MFFLLFSKRILWSHFSWCLMTMLALDFMNISIIKWYSGSTHLSKFSLVYFGFADINLLKSLWTTLIVVFAHYFVICLLSVHFLLVHLQLEMRGIYMYPLWSFLQATQKKCLALTSFISMSLMVVSFSALMLCFILLQMANSIWNTMWKAFFFHAWCRVELYSLILSINDKIIGL